MTDTAAAGRPLPRGPHGLSRAEVEQSQRERLLRGIADAVAEKGYAATSVADVLERAGVSRTTFYQLFDDRLECFLAASRMASDTVVAVMADELARIDLDADASSLERLEQLLAVYLQTLADNPGLARVFLVEVYAAGPEAVAQRRDSLAHFVDLVVASHADADGPLGPGADQRLVAEMLVGAVSSKVTIAVGLGEAADLPALKGDMIRFAARFLATSG